MKSLYLLLTLSVTAAFAYKYFQVNFINKYSTNEERFSGAMQSLDFWTVQRAYPNKFIPANAYYKAYESAKTKLSKSNILAPEW